MTMKDDHDVLRWKHSLPTTEELTPLSKSLLSPAFSSAFSIKPAPLKNGADVSRESLASLLDLRTQSQRSSLPSYFKERKDAGKIQFQFASISYCFSMFLFRARWRSPNFVESMA